MKIGQEQIFSFLKEEIMKAAGEKYPDLDQFFDRLDSARTVGDLRKIVNEFPVDLAIKAADSLVVYNQWCRLAERQSGFYADSVMKKLVAAEAIRKGRRCLI